MPRCRDNPRVDADAFLVFKEFLSQGVPLVMRMKISLWLIAIMNCNFHDNDMTITATFMSHLLAKTQFTVPQLCQKHPIGCFFTVMRAPLNCSL
jgi:hypothetical protein